MLQTWCEQTDQHFWQKDGQYDYYMPPFRPSITEEFALQAKLIGRRTDVGMDTIYIKMTCFPKEQS